MSRYFLVDSRHTLACALNFFGDHLPQDIITVAVTSAGMLACEQAGVVYATLDKFSTRQEIIDLGWSNYSRLEDFCEHWDQIVQEVAPCLRERGIKPFRFGYYDFKILLDSITVKILLLRNFVNEAGNQQIFYAMEQKHEMASGKLLAILENPSIYSVILETFFDRSAQLKPLPIGCQLGKSLRRKFYEALHGLGKHGRNWIKIADQTLNKKSARSFLLFDSGHDINYILPALKGRGFRPFFVPLFPVEVSSDIQEECNNLWSILRNDINFKCFFSYGGLGYFDLVEQALKEYVGSILPMAIARHDQMQKHLTKHPSSFSLTGTINLGLIQRCRMLAAQSHGLPLVTYTEGAGYGSIISPIYDYTEICDGDAMLCYGAGNVEYYEELGRETKLLIPVGSAHQEAVCESYKEQRPPSAIHTIMYVGTCVRDNLVHLPNNGLIATCYFETQLKIFRLLASLPKEIQVVAKLNPGDVVSKDLLCFPEFSRIKIETGKFENVMEGIDLFVIDFPSTVLLSAISTNAYIFVLTEEGVSGFTKKQQDRLEKRAYLFDEFDELAESVREIASDISRYPLRVNADYMQAYSFCRREGKAADRALDAIEQLVTRRV